MQTDLGKLNRIFIAIIAFVGILICVELMVVYFNANFNPEAAPSFCSVNEYIDCDGVAKTVFSRLLGVPFSLWGLGFYMFILGLSIFPFHKFPLFKDFKHPKSYIFLLAIFSIILSAILAYISSHVIEKVCLLCQGLYVVNGLLFFAAKSGSSYPDLFKNAFSDIKNILSDRFWQKLVTVVVLAGIVALAAINIYNPFVSKNDMTVINTEKYYPMGEIGNTLGDEDAKVIIHEYTDYECPFCGISNNMLLRLSKEVPGVKIIHHDYPLNEDCNKFSKGKMHKNSCTAIYYAKAARKQGKFWDMATLLYNNRENLDEKTILALAKTLGLDVEQLKKDAHDNAEFKKEVDRDVTKADSLGINGTPTYMIGIKKYEGIMPYHELKEIILENF